MTEQEIFTRVYLGLKSQGFERSMAKMSRASSQCAYRGDNGLKCSIGHLLSDEEYRLEMESKDVRGLFNEGLLPPRLRDHVEFLSELQSIHDDEEDEDALDTIERRLGRVAKENGFSIPE